MGAHAFRHIRHSCGHSQPAFAGLLGVSADTVRSIEQGRSQVSENVARAVFLATGALPHFVQLPDSLAPEAVAWDRAPYASHHFSEWQKIMGDDLLASLGDTDSRKFAAVMASFFDAAAGAGQLGKYQALIALALHDAAFRLGTASEARALAHSRGEGAAFDVLANIAGR